MQHPIFSPARILVSASLLVGLVASSAHADQQRAQPPAAITVIGEASVTTPPDRAEVDAAVVTTAQTARQAAAENARVLQNVLAALRRALGPQAEIETVSFALRPNYRFPPQGGEPTITGYTATNVVRVTLDDLANVGAVIDTAIQAGANQVERIRFTLRDEGAAKTAALRLAARDARAKASGLAGAVGLRVVRIRSVAETSATPRPFYDLELARAAGPATQIIPGSIETVATVTFTVEAATGREVTSRATPPAAPDNRR